MDEVVKRCDMPVGRKGNKCGDLVPDNAPTTFSVEGVAYEMDLCGKHQDDFLAKISVYTEIARPVRTRAGSAVRQALRGQHGVFTTKDVRNWLREQGREVPDSGRLSNEFIEEYRAAHA